MMRKGLTTICAAALGAGLAACSGGGDNASDEARLNAAAGMLDDNGVYDTSADDAAINQAELPGNEAAPANGANATAAGNSTGSSGNRQ